VYHGIGRCVGCHGESGEGVATLGPSLRGTTPLTATTVAAIAQIITRGAPPTPQYRIAHPSYAGQLSADDVTHLAGYVYTLEHPREPPTDSALAPVPNAPAPNAPAPNATVPNATVPNATVPRAPVPNAATPSASTPPVRHPTVPAPPPSATRRP
jgi:hypothetical protein